MVSILKVFVGNGVSIWIGSDNLWMFGILVEKSEILRAINEYSDYLNPENILARSQKCFDSAAIHSGMVISRGCLYSRMVICSKCNVSEARLFIRGGDGVSGGLWYCDTCCHSLGIDVTADSLELDISILLASGNTPAIDETAPFYCKTCGITRAQFVSTRLLGCAECLTSFSQDVERFMAQSGKFKSSLGQEKTEGKDSLRPTLAEEQKSKSALSFVPSSLRHALQSALENEEYEKAATLRDHINSLDSGTIDSEQKALDFFHLDSGGPLNDVVLRSSVKIFRNIADFPFAGKTRASPEILTRLTALFDSIAGWYRVPLNLLSDSALRCLAEKAILPPHLRNPEIPLFINAEKRLYALLGHRDHISMLAHCSGLDLERLLRHTLGFLDLLGNHVEFAWDKRYGWLSALLDDCGTARALSVLVHVPALLFSGIIDRVLRSLDDQGVEVQALGESGGSLYEIYIESRSPDSNQDVQILNAAIEKLVRSERKARGILERRPRQHLEDEERRAYGILKYATLLDEEEATEYLSILRLAALRNALPGLDTGVLGDLLLDIGPGAIAYHAGSTRLLGINKAQSNRASMIRDRLKLQIGEVK